MKADINHRAHRENKDFIHSVNSVVSFDNTSYYLNPKNAFEIVMRRRRSATGKA